MTNAKKRTHSYREQRHMPASGCESPYAARWRAGGADWATTARNEEDESEEGELCNVAMTRCRSTRSIALSPWARCMR